MTALTRDELVQDLIATRRAMSHLRADLQTARDFCWAAHLVGQDIPGSDVLDIIGWPSEAEGHPRGPK